MKTVSQPNLRPAPSGIVAVETHEAFRKFLLICGIASSLVYVAADVLGALAWPGYDPVSQAVSELGAFGSPSRSIMISMGLGYEILIVAFAWGVLMSARQNRPLAITGTLLLIYGLLGFAAPFTSMHERGQQASVTDTLHLIGAAVTVFLMFLSLAFGAAAFGRRFRLYSLVTIVVLLVFGAIAFQYAPNVAANLPTPWLGLTERINIAVFMLWIIVLAVRLWRVSPQEERI